MPLTSLALRLCRWPMKCQRKASPWAACFASRSCARFSPTTSIPASASAVMSSTATYLVAATIVTSGPTWSRTRARRAAICSADNAEDPVCPSRPAGAPLGEEEIRAATRAEIHALDIGRTRIPRGLLRGSPEVELAFAEDSVSEAVPEPVRDLLAHLVAAGPDRRADHRGEAGADHFSSRFDDAVDQSAPARMDDREGRLRAVRPRHRHQHAVGAESEHRDPRLVRPDRISRDTAQAGFGSVDDGRMRLETEGQRLLIGIHFRAQSAAVLIDALHLVTRTTPQVQRLERPLADAPDAGREDHVVGPVDLPAEKRHAHPISSRAASSSDSRPSSSPFS